MTPDELRGVDARIAVRGFSMQAPWKRVAVILAGPLMNALIAFVLFWALLLSGNINGSLALEDLNPSVATIVPSTSVLAVERGSPAALALRPGDRILAADGVRASVGAVRERTNAHRCAGALLDRCRAVTPVQLEISRNGRVRTESIFPRYSAQSRRMLIGFGFGSPKAFGVFGAARASLSEMWHVTKQTLTGFGHAITSEKARKQVTSIVGITETAHETVVAGAGYALVFVGFISLILAVINMFPFLPLDGGHVLWALAEKVRARRIPVATMYRLSSVGIILMLFLVFNGLSNDISRLGG
jgi:regulator of sigma E protease